ncbi:MAG: valine--tRNA ligase [marine bacterium B5-7]|nr:MAG: valine--tRNA ligase [marine bacterium B5-7]
MSTTPLDKTYDPHTIERPLYQQWEQQGYFEPTGEGEPYCIMIPPPNVTGSLHMGHAFQDTVMDILTRYHRMCGRNTLWQAGSDHAGIATQMVVERQLEQQGITRHDIGREKFVEKVWQWKEQSGGTITGQLRRMGASLDWAHERFTMDDGLSDAVREVFVRLFEEDLIYRGKRLVNWDPVLHTALSDLEVLSAEENGHLWYIRYPVTDSEQFVVVATTRPETMLGDCAVAVNPEDERFASLIGKHLQLPLTGRTIPVIADDYVDPEFGTGCVKITAAHDFNDYAVWQRHREHADIASLPHGGLINIFTMDAAIRQPDEAEAGMLPDAYIGLDRFEARKAIIKDLDATGLLEKTVDHKLPVPRGDRSNAVVEPYLTDQWYVRTEKLAQPAIEAVESGRIRFVPDNWKNTYFEWMRNIEDWCISRQIWWGHRIPAWYDDEGRFYVGRSEEEVRQAHGLEDDLGLRQDDDVLDTWFSSALWPFSTLGWPEQTDRLATWYPTSVLVTGFDIIFFWVARMIMAGLKFMDDIPFHEIYIHGLVRDAHGNKMSKSKGNVLDPIDLIDGIELDALITKRTSGMMQQHLADKITKQTREDYPNGIPSYGTDALRFTFASLATTGRDINFDLGRIEGYRNFCNKLWNAARYVLMNTEDQDCGVTGNASIHLGVAERWIISRLQATEAEVERAFKSYRFDLAAMSIYNFVWNDYCDWYLELSKPVLNDDTAAAEAKRGTRRTLVRVLETTLRLAHPIIPFITDTIWQRIAPLAGTEGRSIMILPYPKADMERIDQDAEDGMQWLQQFILGIRKIKAEMNIRPSAPVSVLLSGASETDRQRVIDNRMYLNFLARTQSVDFLGDNDEGPEAAITLVGAMKVLIPLAGLIDRDAEITRLSREIDKLETDRNKIAGKLANSSFVDRAPAAIVEKERSRLKQISSDLDNLQDQLSKIRALQDVE